MKRNSGLLAGITVLMSSIFLVYSCSKQGVKRDPKDSQVNVLADKNLLNKDINQALTTNGTDSCHSCNKYFSASHAGTGFYTYPAIPLNLSCAANNSTVTLACVYYDVPNRFTIYDKNGNQVITTGYVGDAHCQGPWGTSVTTNQATVYTSFTYSSSLAPYKLLVDTKVTGCSSCSSVSPDPGCSDQDDNWQVKVSCVQNGTGCSPQPCTTTDTCKSCNKYYNATHAGVGPYTYPQVPLDLSCAVNNSTVTVGCVYYDVPNRFTIRDKNSNVVVTTGWIGNAHCQGPWGTSVTTNQAEVFMNFAYNSTLAPYKLEVNTMVIGCNGCSSVSPDPGCTDQDDNWQAHVSCIIP